MFDQKLSYLTAITQTTNAELANAINLSESCISRWKNGKRKPPRNATYINDIVNFFYKAIIKRSLEYKFNDIFVFDNENFKQNFEKWFKDKNSTFENKSITTPSNTVFYYGDEGKRKAVLRFLQSQANKTNQTLYFYTDESISWMYNDEFASEWTKLLVQILKNNNKLKVIHTIIRDYNEILVAVSKWIPIYLTGNIEPYYFPRLRDGVTRRSLFISSNDAVISSSIGHSTDDMLNIYIKDLTAIASIKKEFNNYLALCKPLMNVLSNPDKSKINELCKKEENNIVIDSYSLSFISAPDDIINKVLKESNNEKLIDAFLERKKVLLKNLDNYKILDLINVCEEFNKKIPYCFIHNKYYEKEDYIKQLKNVIYLLENYENYDVVIKNDSVDSTSIYIKEETELVIERNDTNTILISNEKTIVQEFYEQYKVNKKPESKIDTINRIKEIISKL